MLVAGTRHSSKSLSSELGGYPDNPMIRIAALRLFSLSQ
jgi:hypothetical protein